MCIVAVKGISASTTSAHNATFAAIALDRVAAARMVSPTAEETRRRGAAQRTDISNGSPNLRLTPAEPRGREERLPFHGITRDQTRLEPTHRMRACVSVRELVCGRNSD